jgi:hypothetical protein
MDGWMDEWINGWMDRGIYMKFVLVFENHMQMH